ncbi:NAD-dependent epimerase/dehydratase family protein [Bradyrhizobium xenonodulans]|uniref:NAD-dependent epimerase/dehydratase family protein n=1 Tax=Bradyrhizobium xenonodulans TaxID=2736875 RepID=A0ABY7MPJ4_9BRAD|nr:NAD-dependent epimerase/dehydratase family protein [Bradyrhizobium xenonodulans]WBL80303.1 NAD-dependent epimerase/dehydratase family protein [Bradyrhizobium xenonodulans]
MSSQAIIFGGAGFVGTHLAERLVASQAYSRIVSIDIGQPRATVPGVEYLHHDVRETIDARIANGKPADIFNLAAIHVTPGHPEGDYYNTNILGAVNVCKFANATASRNIVFTSSISIYGPNENELDEDATPAPVSAYGRSKLSAEKIKLLWQSEASDRKLTIVRPAVIFGLYERGNFTRLSRVMERKAFIYPGRSDTIKSCGYVKDLVSSMIHMSARNHGVSIYNFCFEHRYTISEICTAFSRVAGYRRPRLTIPIWFMNLAVLPFEALHAIGINTGINRDRVRKLWFSTNILPKRLVECGFKFSYDLESSLAEWKRESCLKDFD